MQHLSNSMLTMLNAQRFKMSKTNTHITQTSNKSVSMCELFFNNELNQIRIKETNRNELSTQIGGNNVLMIMGLKRKTQIIN